MAQVVNYRAGPTGARDILDQILEWQLRIIGRLALVGCALVVVCVMIALAGGSAKVLIIPFVMAVPLAIEIRRGEALLLKKKRALRAQHWRPIDGLVEGD